MAEEIMSIPMVRYEVERAPRSNETLPWWLPKPSATYALMVSVGLDLAMRSGSSYQTKWDAVTEVGDLPRPMQIHYELVYSRREIRLSERITSGDWKVHATYRLSC